MLSAGELLVLVGVVLALYGALRPLRRWLEARIACLLRGSSAQDDDSIDLPTKEGQHIRQDISVTYNTSHERAGDVFRSFRGADIADIERTFVRRTIITVSQNAAGQMSLTDLISNQRGLLQ